MKKIIILIAITFAFNTLNAQTDKTQATNNKFRLTLEAGYSYRTAPLNDETPDDFNEYLTALKSGLNLETHLSYFVAENWGLGITYNRFNSKADITFTDFNNDSDIFTDNISIAYIAPEYLYRGMSNDNKHAFIMSTSIGYLAYKDQATINNTNIDIKGANLGVGIGVAYDFYITPSIAIGASANYITGTLRKITVTANGQTEEVKLEDDELENLARININGGLRFYF